MTNRGPANILATLVVALFVPLSNEGHAQTASFTPLGDFPNGFFWSQAWDVSSDGTFITGFGSHDVGSQADAFVWIEPGIFQPVGVPSVAWGFGGFVVGRDPFGVFVAGANDNFGAVRFPFRWSPITGIVTLGKPVDTEGPCSAFGASEDGLVVVGSCFDSIAGGKPFRWTSALGVQSLATPMGFSGGSAVDASADGSVVVGCLNSGSAFECVTPNSAVPRRLFCGGVGGFRWASGEGMTKITDGCGRAISADGETVVGQEGNQAFRWTSGSGIHFLGVLGGEESSVANDASADGAVIVGRSFTGNQPQAFVWSQDSGMDSIAQRLGSHGIDVRDWTLTSANGVSGDGMTIVGEGINPNGDIEAWRAVLPVPEPSRINSVLAMLCALGLVKPQRPKVGPSTT